MPLSIILREGDLHAHEALVIDEIAQQLHGRFSLRILASSADQELSSDAQSLIVEVFEFQRLQQPVFGLLHATIVLISQLRPIFDDPILAFELQLGAMLRADSTVSELQLQPNQPVTFSEQLVIALASLLQLSEQKIVELELDAIIQPGIGDASPLELVSAEEPDCVASLTGVELRQIRVSDACKHWPG